MIPAVPTQQLEEETVYVYETSARMLKTRSKNIG